MAESARPVAAVLKKHASASERRPDTVSIIHLAAAPGTGVRALHAPLGTSVRTDVLTIDSKLDEFFLLELRAVLHLEVNQEFV